MLLSARAAAALLAPVGLSRERARLLLATGIAGEGVRAGGALLYDEARVRELAARTPIRRDEVAAACPHGVFVARLGPRARVDLAGDPAEFREPASGPWKLSFDLWATLRVAASRGVRVPLVATVGGFAVHGADIVDVRDAGVAGNRLVLEAPGAWCDTLVGRRWLAGRGGPPLLVWGWSPRLATG